MARLTGRGVCLPACLPGDAHHRAAGSPVSVPFAARSLTYFAPMRAVVLRHHIFFPSVLCAPDAKITPAGALPLLPGRMSDMPARSSVPLEYGLLRTGTRLH